MAAYKRVSPQPVAEGGTGATTLTAHGVLLGEGTSAITPTAVGTNGQVLVGSSAADPGWVTPTAGTGLSVTANASTHSYALSTPVTVANGGTGDTSLTAYAVLCGGTTTTNPVQSIASVGTSGQFLTSNGAGALPTFQTAGAASITITGDSGGGLTSSSFTFTGGTTGLTFAGAGSTETLGGALVVANGGTGRATSTAYAVICGGTTSTGAQQSIASVGTSGQVLVSNGAGALPTFQAVPASSATGTPIQQKRTTSSSATSTTKAILNSTTPTTSNTTSLFSISFTPTSSSNTLLFQAAIPILPTVATGAAIICLFSGTTLLVTAPVSAIGSNSAINTANLYYEATAGTTSTTTYAIYYAGNGTVTGTTYVNQDVVGNTLGSSLTATFTITEVLT